MSTENDWDDQKREALRWDLHCRILGALRLGRQDSEAILEYVRENIEDVSPETEWESLFQFASDEIVNVASQLKSEQAQWPVETDCDRLDRVETELRKRGILLWQASPCCDSCTNSEIPDRILAIDRRHPGFSSQIRGYSFFIDQNLPEELADGTDISVYLAYGWISQDSTDEEIYKQHALGVAAEICDCLSDAGFEADWDGDFARKIRLALNWQRRTMLE